MIRVLNRYLPGRLLVLIIAENTLIAASVCVIASRNLWSKSGNLVPDPSILVIGTCIALVCQLTFYYFNLYDLRSIASKRALLSRLLSASGTCCLLLAISAAIFAPLRTEAGIVEITFICLLLIILSARLSLEWIHPWIKTSEPILVVGSGDVARNIVREIQARSDLPLRLLGNLAESDGDTPIPGVKLLGTVKDLDKVLEQRRPQRIVLAAQDESWRVSTNTLLRYRTKGVNIEEASTLFEKLTGRIPIETIRAKTLLFSEGFNRRNTLEIQLARILAILASLVGLLLFLPLMLLTALAIRLESKGPIFFRQERVGREGKVFEILKFRSMRVDAEEATKPQWACVNDPRITWVGSLIRKLRIDEIPQLVNILAGDMNLVGPRPERPFFVDMLKDKIPYYDLRHSIRPGLTGWAQVCYPYGSTVEDQKSKLEFDLFYLKNACFAFDLAVLFKTVGTVLLGKGR